ncbi:MAG: LTA synthase family protein [Chthoniobacterales bacterium]
MSQNNESSQKISLWRFWLTGYIFFFLFILWDAALAFWRPGELRFSFLAYACSLIISFLFWTALRLLSLILPYHWQNILAGIVAFMSALILIINTGVYLAFGQYLSGSMIHFLDKDPTYIWAFIKVYFLGWLGIALIILSLIFYFGWHQRIQSKFSLRRTYLLLFATSLLLLSILINLGSPLSRYRIGIDSSVLIAFLDTGSSKEIVNLQFGNRRAVAPPTDNKKFTPNVLLFANESLGRRIGGLSFYGDNTDAMPFLSSLIKSKPHDFFIFKNALSNSTATDVSLPSLFTGIGPELSAQDLFQAPLLWDWLKAANPDYKTVFGSPVVFSWSHLNQILGFSEVDEVYTSEELPGEFINDLGIDEAIAARKFAQTLGEIPNEQHFVAAYFSNALHNPFQTESLFFNGVAPGDTRFHKALHIVDAAFKEIWIALETSGKLDDTIIIITGDHGEMDVPTQHGHRLYSFYEEYWGVTFIIIIPEALQRKIPSEKIEALRNNQKKLISNLDIIPSLADLFSLENTNQLNVKALGGASLFKELSEDRFVIGLSTNDIRSWTQEGFGIARGNKRLIYNNVSGIFYYDLSADPEQKNNLIKTLSPKEEKRYLDIIQANKHLQRILRPPSK